MIPQHTETVEVKSESKIHLMSKKTADVNSKTARQFVKPGVGGKAAAMKPDTSGKAAPQSMMPKVVNIKKPSRPVIPKVYKCHKCSCTFSSVESLKEHKSTHYDNKIYKCKLCDFFAIRSTNLSVHVRRTHNHIKPHKCYVCQKGFYTKGHLS